MKFFIKFLQTAFAALALTFTIASCSDDNDEPNPVVEGSNIAEVFPMGVPAQVGDMKIEVNNEGKVTKIVVDNDEEITFEYGDFSRATPFNAVMRYRCSEMSDNYDIYLQLNKQGFITLASMIQDSKEEGKWEFEYDADGHITHTKSQWFAGEYDQEATIKYVNGDITEYKVFDAGDYLYYTVRYTNSAFNQPVPNKGGIMLFEEIFDIDLDEIELAYYVGLLGKGTKNLPMAIHESETESDAYTDDYEFGWEFNSDMLPIKFYDLDIPDMGGIHFRWR